MKYDSNLKVLQVYPDFVVNGFYTSDKNDTSGLKCIYTIENITKRAPQAIQMKEEDLITKVKIKFYFQTILILFFILD